MLPLGGRKRRHKLAGSTAGAAAPEGAAVGVETGRRAAFVGRVPLTVGTGSTGLVRQRGAGNIADQGVE